MLYQLHGVAESLLDPHEHEQSCALSVSAEGKAGKCLKVGCVNFTRRLRLTLCATYCLHQVSVKTQQVSDKSTNQGVDVPDQDSHVFFDTAVDEID